MLTSAKCWESQIKGKTSWVQLPTPSTGQHSAPLTTQNTLESPSIVISAGNPTFTTSARRATAHLAFFDATWGNALLASRNRPTRRMSDQPWNMLPQYGNLTPKIWSPIFKWSSDMQPGLLMQTIASRAVSPSCFRASNGSPFKNAVHTAKSSCCTGSSMGLSPSLLLLPSCIPHQTWPDATTNNSDNNTAEFSLFNTVSSQVWSAYGMPYLPQWCRLHLLRPSGATWHHSLSAISLYGKLFTRTCLFYFKALITVPFSRNRTFLAPKYDNTFYEGRTLPEEEEALQIFFFTALSIYW